MSPHRAAWLAWCLAVLAMLILAASIVLSLLSRGHKTPAGDFGPEAIGWIVAFFALAGVGALVASRRPGNPIGWLFVGGALGLVLDFFTSSYANYALFAKPGSLPGGAWMAWSSVWVENLTIALPALLLLLFPDGRLPSRRWRLGVWLLVIGVVVGVLSSAFKTGILRNDLPIDNPVGIKAVGAFVDATGVVSWLCLVGVFVAAAVSMIVRLVRARGEERAQLKWMVFAAALLLVGFVGANFADSMGNAAQVVADVVISLAFAGVPIAAGIAILRYRLYEIDRVVSRTLVYGLLTAGLAGLYFGVVIALQQVFGGLTRGNDLAIAGSTLAVAALFRPARRWIQGFVDRRFYRQRYDAAQMLEGFSARLRDEVDLDTVGSHFGSVVREAMQPAHLSLWLRNRELGT